MTNSFYVVRCYVRAGNGYAVEDRAETDAVAARQSASRWAEVCIAVVVIDPSGGIIAQFGVVPEF